MEMSVSEANGLSQEAPADNETSFLERATAALGESNTFGVLAIRVDNIDMIFFPEKVISNITGIIEAISKSHGYAWQRSGTDLFECCLPDTDEQICRETADEIRRRILPKDETVSIGIAVYPMITYEKEEVFNNAKKALAHAAFFGPGSTVCFDAISLNISGDTYYQAGDLEAAMKEYERALVLDPKNVNVHNSIGVCHGDREEWENALASFDKAIELDPNDVFAIYNAGYIYLQRNEYETVLDYFMRAIKIDANIFELLFHTGRVLYELDRPEEAISYINRAILETENPGAIVYRYFGDCNLALGRTDEAIKAYNTALKLRPDDAHSLSALALCYENEGINAEIALMFAENATEIQPDNGLFQHRLAVMYLNRNRLELALDHFESALEFDHEESAAYIESTRDLITGRAEPEKAASP